MCTANGGKELNMLVFTELIKHCTSNLHQNTHTCDWFLCLDYSVISSGIPHCPVIPTSMLIDSPENHRFYHIPSLNCPDLHTTQNLILSTLWLSSKKWNCFPTIFRWCEKQYFTFLRANPLCWNSALSVMRSTWWNVFRYFLMILINQTCFL